jgi:hypothetical protein
MAWTKEDIRSNPIVETKYNVEEELIRSGLPYVKLNSGGVAEHFLGTP